MKKRGCIMKKFLSALIFALTFSLCAFSATACNEKSTVSLEYNIIDGKNEYAVIGISDATATEIYIPEKHDGKPVTEIAETAFYGNNAIEKVEMSDNIVAIGENAFKKCENLKSVKLSRSITALRQETFSYCYKLSDITIPAGVVKIENGAFKECSSLTEINIPSTVTEIDNEAFYECPLSEITIPNHVTRIGDHAFAYTGIKSLTLGGNVETIGNGAFGHCALLENLVIPDKVTVIGDQAFINCVNLNGATFGESVAHIGNGAFYGCKKLTGVIFPDALVTVGDDAFLNCENLLTASFRGQKITHIGSAAFRGTQIGAIEIPYSVENIGQDAFKDCPCVKETGGLSYVDKWLVKCDETLTTAEIKADTVGIAHNAFFKCFSLTEITLPENVKSIGRSAFYQCGITKIEVHPFNDNFISVNGDLFSYDRKILICCATGKTENEFTVPDGVTEIREFAFNYCATLTSLYIPESVTAFGDAAFYGCVSLTDIYYGGTISQWEMIEKGTLYNAGVPENCALHFTEINVNGGDQF